MPQHQHGDRALRRAHDEVRHDAAVEDAARGEGHVADVRAAAACRPGRARPASAAGVSGAVRRPSSPAPCMTCPMTSRAIEARGAADEQHEADRERRRRGSPRSRTAAGATRRRALGGGLRLPRGRSICERARDQRRPSRAARPGSARRRGSRGGAPRRRHPRPQARRRRAAGTRGSSSWRRPPARGRAAGAAARARETAASAPRPAACPSSPRSPASSSRAGPAAPAARGTLPRGGRSRSRISSTRSSSAAASTADSAATSASTSASSGRFFS